jgi:UDP-2-acetamido-3-amino-2,3-dideoxy-glucuronate N-acetyltransferase
MGRDRVSTAPKKVQTPADVFVHPTAIVESPNIGAGSRIWAFAHVLPRARIGRDANICDHVFIENDVILGDRVTVKSGVQLWDGVHAEDDVFIGPNATFVNDPFPRSKQYPAAFTPTLLRRGCSIGAGAVVLAGVTVGPYAMVGAGAVVTSSVPPYAIVVGNPAAIRGYVDAEGRAPIGPSERDDSDRDHPVNRVRGVRLLSMPVVEDVRGMLSFAEIGTHLPFEPKRYFVVFDVPSQKVRGEHAHKSLHQVLVCLRGSVSVVVDDGIRRAEVLMDGPQRALYVPPMIWCIQYRYTSDAMLLVLASDKYDAADYIRDYDEFEHLLAKRR